MQARPMTATNAIDPSLPPQASDLPPELSALIEAAIARAAGRTTPTAPTLPVRSGGVVFAPAATHQAQEADAHYRSWRSGVRWLLRWVPLGRLGEPADRHQHGRGWPTHDKSLHHPN